MLKGLALRMLERHTAQGIVRLGFELDAFQIIWAQVHISSFAILKFIHNSLKKWPFGPNIALLSFAGYLQFLSKLHDFFKKKCEKERILESVHSSCIEQGTCASESSPCAICIASFYIATFLRLLSSKCSSSAYAIHI